MQSQAFQWQFVTFFRILFAAHLLYSGGAYIFFGWVPSAMGDPNSPVGRFMVELDNVGLYPLVKYIEFFPGLLALSNRFTPLAAVMEFPITVIIAYLNIFVESALASRHLYTGVQELVINGIVLLRSAAFRIVRFSNCSRPVMDAPDAGYRPRQRSRPATRPPHHGHRTDRWRHRGCVRGWVPWGSCALFGTGCFHALYHMVDSAPEKGSA